MSDLGPPFLGGETRKSGRKKNFRKKVRFQIDFVGRGFWFFYCTVRENETLKNTFFSFSRYTDIPFILGAIFQWFPKTRFFFVAPIPQANIVSFHAPKLFPALNWN